MIEKTDIIQRIKFDFGQNTDEAIRVLQEKIDKVEYLNHDRIIRCIIYLSKGSIGELNHMINQAKQDPRDVMLWAEYEGLNENELLKRVRDFNKTFEDCENNVNE